MRLRVARIHDVTLQSLHIDVEEVAAAISKLLKENNDGMISQIPTPFEVINNPERYYVLYNCEGDNIDDAVIGVVALHRARNRIMRLCVKREYRRRGYGRLLLAYAVLEARRLELRSVHLYVKKDNAVMQRLAEKLGFQRVEELERSYKYALNL